MKFYFTLLAASAAVAQPVMAQEIVIRCPGESNMTIYNPHGKGGTIGGPSPYTWTVRTDGRSVSLSSQGETGTSTVQARDVQLSPSSLSFCATADASPCDVIQTKPRSRGGTMSVQVTRTTVTSGGTFSYDFSSMIDNAPMKTGFAATNRGQCDEAAIAELNRLAAGGTVSRTPPDSPTAQATGPSTAGGDQSGQDQAAVDEEQRRLESERQRQAEAAAAAEHRRQAEAAAEQRRQAEALRRREEERLAAEKAEAEKRKREEEERRRADEQRNRDEEANRLVEFKEGIVLCEPQGGASRTSRCFGPLQMTIIEVKTLDDPATRGNIGMACGSDRSLRDLGIVQGMRAFGCGFGIHPDPAMVSYPGNNDVPARYGIYISGRGTFHCKRSVSAYCRGQ